MQVKPIVSFHGIPVDEAVRSACLSEIEKLEHWFDRITSCHVTVGMPHRRQHTGNHFDLHVRMALPGGEIVVSREPDEHVKNESATHLVHDAFDEVRRQLQDHVARIRGNVQGRNRAPTELGDA